MVNPNPVGTPTHPGVSSVENSSLASPTPPMAFRDPSEEAQFDEDKRTIYK
jgi:hypothetical protein